MLGYFNICNPKFREGVKNKIKIFVITRLELD